MKGSTQWLLWRRFTVRHWLHAPGASITLTLILALGVAVFYSIRLANRSAVAGFSQFSTTLTGDADLVLTADAGRLPESVLPSIRRRLGDRPAALVPILEATASLPHTGGAADDFDARQVELIGIDLIAIQNLRYARDGGSRATTTFASPTGSLRVGPTHQVFLSRTTADRLGVAVEETIEVILSEQAHRLTVAAILESEDGAIAVPDSLMVMDLPALQTLTGREGWLDRIEVFLPDSRTPDARLAEVEGLLAGGADPVPWQIESAGDRKASAREMTAAFRANLTILSGLALLVGVYLILQALEAAVVRRRPEIATLLSLGVSAQAIRRAWVLESATFGLVGTGLGLLLGYGGAQFAVQGVARTVNALYLNTEASAASWHWGEAAVALALGMGASLLAGILPARDAALTPPAHVLKQGTHSPGIKLLDRPWQGILLLVAGFICIQLPPVEWSGKVRFPAAGYLGAVCWLTGASVVVSALFPALARLLRPSADRSAAFRIALSQFRRPSGRHKLTVAGLVVAVSMASGMGILIHSFEGTMQHWIHSNLKADLFVACKGVQNASNRNRISEAAWREMARDPAVASVDVGHIHIIRLEGASTFLVGARLGGARRDEHLMWVDRRGGESALDRPDPDGAWPAYISESFSRRFDRAVGDPLTIPTPAGDQALRIAGIFADYGNERGSIVMDPDRVVDWFGDASAVNVAATLRPGADGEALRQRWMAAYPGLAVRSNAALRAEVLRIFRQTFSITYALKIIGIVVAVAGLVLALVSLLLERRRDITTLREVGMSRRQIRCAVMVEGAGVAGIGLVGGLLLSLALGYILIFVINRQSFGWTLGYAVPWGSTAMLAGLVLAASVLSAGGVGHWAARLKGEQEE